MVKQVISGVLTASLLCLMPVVMAADETMDSSVYLVFDPATGQFVSKTKVLSESNQTIDTGIEQGQPFVTQSQTATDAARTVTGADQSPVGAGPAVDAKSEPMVDSSTSNAGTGSGVIIGAFIVLAVLGGFIFRRRSSRKEIAQN